MTPSVLSSSGSWPRSRPPSFAERAVIRALEPMRLGRLRLELPGGEVREFGTGGRAAVLRIRDTRFFSRCLWFGDIGFGESYLSGEWETDDLVAVFQWFLANLADAPGLSGSRRRGPLNLIGFINRWRHRLRPNSPSLSRRNIQEHYDLSNAFFATFLDPGMTYSSAWWPQPHLTLEEAQAAKYERLCQKLRLSPEDHVLEIGCGWGGFALHAATRHGCRVTGITLSEEQFRHARARVAAAGLGDRVRIELRDYRHVRGRFSRIASIEMLEAVGHQYQPAFAAACARLLKSDGLLGLQFITCPDARYDQLRRGVDFIQRHIFPGSLLLSLNRLNGLLASAGGFGLHDFLDFGPDYARTLREWRDSFNRQGHAVQGLGFDRRFQRKWDYYLAYCEAAFATRNISVVHAIYTRPNNATLDAAA